LRPDWLKSKDLLVGSDYEALQIEFMHPEIVALQFPWGRLQCDRNQFVIATVQEPIIAVADFFVKCFQMLPETPINALGINREVHFPAGGSEAFHRIGDTLTPKTFWDDLMFRDDERIGGLRSLIMEQAVSKGGVKFRVDGNPGYVQFRVEPSQRPDLPFGVFSQLNDHYDLPMSEGRTASDLVAGSWDSTMTRAELWFDQIMSLTDASK
jgi:hypothetical protein